MFNQNKNKKTKQTPIKLVIKLIFLLRKISELSYFLTLFFKKVLYSLDSLLKSDFT